MAASVSSAHDQTGALGKAISATDVYQVHCYDDGNGKASYLSFQIQDALPVAAPIISAQVTLGASVAANTTDAIDGDAAYSPALNLKGGNESFYLVTVDKTKAGTENYTFQYHCMTATNVHTGTDILQLVNQ